MAPTHQVEISVVIPAFNEMQNVPLMHHAVTDVMERMGVSYEVIFIDDGSKDGTFDLLATLQASDPHLVLIRFRRNFGQTAAMDAGFKHARGKIIVTMDADLQNDPQDIPLLVSTMRQKKLDVVSGWRWPRHDPVGKRCISLFANALRKAITGERIHDSGCTLKAFKRECFDGLDLYGEMHRYIPAILMWRGFTVGEVKVHHHARRYGKTKYSMTRIFKGFLDLLVVKFWMQYSARPIHLFGSVGLLSTIVGALIGAYLTFMKLVYGVSISNRPLMLLAVLLIIIGMQFVAFGLIADILIKLFYRGVPNYTIKEIRD